MKTFLKTISPGRSLSVLRSPFPVLRSLFSVLLIAIALLGCSDDDKSTPHIALTAPADGATVNLSEVGDVTFSWNSSEAFSDYYVLFSTSNTFDPVERVDAASSPLTLSKGRLNRMFDRLGVAVGAPTPVYWSVEAADGDAETETRTLTLTRYDAPVITVTSPAEGAYINLATAGTVTFAWTVTPPGTELKVILGMEPDLSDGFSLPLSGQTSPLSLPAEVINAAALSYVSPGAECKLYWALIPAGDDPEPDQIRTLNVKTFINE